MTASQYIKYFKENGTIPECDDQELILACGFFVGAVGMRRLDEIIVMLMTVEIAAAKEIAKREGEGKNEDHTRINT